MSFLYSVTKRFKRLSFYKSTQLIYNIFKFFSRRVSILYSANIVFVAIVSFLLFYYLVVVNIKPFSSSYVTGELASVMSKGEFNFKPSQVYVSFTKRWTVKLNLTNSDFSIKENRVDVLNRLSFESLEMEIPIYRILFFNFTPSFLIIDDAEIDFNSTSFQGLGSGKPPNLKIFDILSFFNKVKLTNVKILVKNKVKGDVALNLKSSDLSIDKNGDFAIDNLSEIDYNNKIMKISSNCAFDFNFRGNCRFYFSDFDISIMSKLFDDQSPFDNFDGFSDIGIALSYDKDIELDVKISSKKINIPRGDKFHKKLSLKDLNFNIFSKIHDGSSSIKINGSHYISTSVDEDSSGKISYNINSNNIDSKISVDVRSEKIRTSEVLAIWPNLYFESLKNWLLKNVNGGIVKSSNVTFELTKNQKLKSYKIDKFTALINLFDVDLLYSKNLPSLKKCDMDLNLTANNLEININSARTAIDDQLKGVLNISDLKNKPTIIADLEFEGPSPDFFAHIGHKNNNLNSKLKSFFEGSRTKSAINFEYPIFGPASARFADSVFNLNIETSSIYNDYMSGSFTSLLKKTKNSSFFSLSSNFNDSFTLRSNILDIKKNHDDSLALKFDFSPSKRSLIFKNLLLSYNNGDYFIKIPNFLFDKERAKVGNLEYIQNTQNQNFSFLVNSNSPDNFSYNINGELITIPAKTGQGGDFFKIFNFKRFSFDFNLKKIRSIKNSARDLSGFLYCARGFCPEISANGFYDSGLLFKFKNRGRKSYIFDIFDFGYFLDVFNISKSFEGGQLSAHAKYVDDSDQGNQYRIVVDSQSPIVFYDNAETKKMEADSFFVKIKEKIFSNDKTTFSRVHSELDYNVDQKILNINKFIANNFKIGVTSKGLYNFNSKILKVDGMIIPSYFINNLFGIGNIPILGDIVNNLITGDKDGGVLGLRYKYTKNFSNKSQSFKTYPMSSVLPSSIQMFFID